MSYDLFFRRRNGSLTIEEFRSYFAGRINYEVGESQVGYGNQETGVYFSFEFRNPAELEAEDPTIAYAISLNINFFRPSYFLLEAEPEVTAFVREFDLTVLDPQMEGMGEGEYTPNGLAAGWNAGNEFAYRAFLTRPDRPENLKYLPTNELLRVWRWNFGRIALQQEYSDDDVFVPLIMFFDIAGNVATASVWPDAIPVVLPRVDFVIIGRDRLAPRGWFKKKKDSLFLRWDRCLPKVAVHDSRKHAEAVSLAYRSPPADLIAFVSQLQIENPTAVGIRPDQVLNKELIEKYLPMNHK